MAELRARVTASHEVAKDTVVVEAQLIEPPRLVAKPGQFLSIRIDASGDLRRSYTLLSTTPDGERFELLVKRVAGGAGSGFFASLALGDELRFTGPMGFFTPDPAHDGDALVIATGAGIAAALPVARAILDAGAATETTPARRVLLLYGVRDPADALLVDRLAGLAWEQVIGADWPAVHATLATRAVALLPALRDPRFYLTGNGDMTRAVRDALVAIGVDRRKQIRTEIFYPVAEP